MIIDKYIRYIEGEPPKKIGLYLVQNEFDTIHLIHCSESVPNAVFKDAFSGSIYPYRILRYAPVNRPLFDTYGADFSEETPL